MAEVCNVLGGLQHFVERVVGARRCGSRQGLGVLMAWGRLLAGSLWRRDAWERGSTAVLVPPSLAVCLPASYPMHDSSLEALIPTAWCLLHCCSHRFPTSAGALVEGDSASGTATCSCGDIEQRRGVRWRQRSAQRQGIGACPLCATAPSTCAPQLEDGADGGGWHEDGCTGGGEEDWSGRRPPERRYKSQKDDVARRVRKIDG